MNCDSPGLGFVKLANPGVCGRVIHLQVHEKGALHYHTCLKKHGCLLVKCTSSMLIMAKLGMMLKAECTAATHAELHDRARDTPHSHNM